MYTFDKILPDTSFDSAVTRTKEALAAKGFGVLTEIDVRKTMKAKLDADIENYMILAPAIRRWPSRHSSSSRASAPCCRAT